MRYVKITVSLFFILQILTVFPALSSETVNTLNLEKSELSDWRQNVVGNICEMEYEVSWQYNCQIPAGKAGYHMVNRDHNLRLYFYPEGIRMIRRSQSSPSWVFGCSLAGLRQNRQKLPLKPELKNDKNRIEFIQGDIIESYENTKDGIKYHLELKKSPGNTESLAIVWNLTGDLTPVIRSDSSLEFQKMGKGMFQINALSAKDAQGAALPFNASLNDSELEIALQDQGAEYPIQLDFLISSLPPWSAEPDIAKINFGDSVATAGDVNGDGFSDIIIGAPNYDNGQTDEGRVYLYLGSASGPGGSSNWQFESDNADAKLGDCVSTAGDINGDGYSDVIIGAPGYDNDQTDEGCALIFYGSASGLGNVPVILDADQGSSKFGYSVSTAGDVNKDGYSDVIIGAYTYQNTLSEEGMVFVFHGNDAGIITPASWSKSGGQAGAHFGYSAGFAGDVNRDGYSDVVIGARYYNNGNEKQGMAYVYLGGDSGLAASPVWSDDGNATNDYLGWSVSTAGDVNADGYADVIVGVPGYDNGETSEGAARIYHGSVSGLSSSPDVTLEVNSEFAYFGSSVFTAGDVNADGYADVIVGAYYSSNEEIIEGSAYVYSGSKEGLKSLPDWMDEANQYGANYGGSVSTAGDVNGDGYSDIIVGASYYDNGQDTEGKCFLYYGEPKPPSPGYAWEIIGTQADSDFGMTVASAGDVNGDGYADIMIGAPFFDNGQTNEGKVYIYHGRPNSAPEITPARTLESNQANYQFGYSLAPADDLNGDGYGDIIIGAPGYTNNAGLARIFYGSASGIGNTFDWSLGLAMNNARFGESVAGAGDVNGDGYADIIVGAPGFPNGENKGKVYVYLGDFTGVPYSEQWDFTADKDNSYFGISVGSAGDVNGDGYSDVIVGAYGYTNDLSNEGRAYVFYGSYNGIGSSGCWIGEGDQVSCLYGNSVSSAGDVNGDGYSDVIVGAPNYDNGVERVGAAFIYPGGSGGLSGSAYLWLGEGTQVNSYYGYSVAGAGDVNGDGYSDVIVGAYSYDCSVTKPFPFTFIDAGAAYIYLGSDSGPDTSSDWIAASRSSNHQFGRCVASAGDVNGDGFSDVIIGVPGHKVTTDRMGRAAIYLGGGGNGRSVNLKQLNFEETKRICRLSRTDDDKFVLGTQMFTPFGRGFVKQEWEMKPFGTLLDGTNTFIPISWYETISAPGLKNYIGYEEGILYHWRCRILYHPVTSPYQSRGRWLQIPWNGAQEADFRIGPTDTPDLQDIINYILGRHHYPHDINGDSGTNAADVIYYLKNN